MQLSQMQILCSRLGSYFILFLPREDDRTPSYIKIVAKGGEVLSLLPSYEGKSVLELGAGIGRFTGELAKEAGHVLALDFIESVNKKAL